MNTTDPKSCRAKWIQKKKWTLFPLISLLALVFLALRADAMEFSLQKNVKLDTCSIWSVPVFDGSDIVVSCEGNGKLYALKYDLNLNLKKAAKMVASSSDFQSPDSISDHKHVFQNGYHYIVFSKRGSGSGGELVLIKLDTALNRVGKVAVVKNSSPTNDMFLVGDGTRIYVGKYSPETGGHKVYIFSEDLEQIGEPVTIGGFDQRFGDLGHSNGAVALFDQDAFYLVAPNTLSPGDGNYFYLLKFDSDWEPMARRDTIYEDRGDLGIVSGLVKGSDGNFFLLNFVTRSPGEQEVIGPIYAALYDADWNLISSDEILEGNFQRPHSVLVGDDLFIGYDEEKNGFSAYISKFKLTYDESEFRHENDTPSESGGQETPAPAVETEETKGLLLDPSKISLSISLNTTATPQLGEPSTGNGPMDTPPLEEEKGSVTPLISLSLSGYGDAFPTADWWLVVVAPDGLLQLNVSDWNWEFIGDDLTRLRPVIQYDLVPLSSVPLPEFQFIVSGTYYFFFGLDAPDNSLNQDILYTVVTQEVE